MSLKLLHCETMMPRHGNDELAPSYLYFIIDSRFLPLFQFMIITWSCQLQRTKNNNKKQSIYLALIHPKYEKKKRKDLMTRQRHSPSTGEIKPSWSLFVSNCIVLAPSVYLSCCLYPLVALLQSRTHIYIEISFSHLRVLHYTQSRCLYSQLFSSCSDMTD